MELGRRRIGSFTGLGERCAARGRDPFRMTGADRGKFVAGRAELETTLPKILERT